MDYSFLVTVAQVSGLALMGVGAVALMRLIIIHYVQHDWGIEQVQYLRVITASKAAGLLLLAYSGGGHLATRLFETNQLPNLPMLGMQAFLLAILAATVIFVHVVAGPWLSRLDRNAMAARPLVLDVTAHRTLALTLALAAFAAAWTLWVVLALVKDAPMTASTLSALTLMTLVFWAVLALPALLLRALAVHAVGGSDEQVFEHQSGPARVIPMIPDVPQHRYAHVPAPRAPRPRLVLQNEDVTG